MRETLKQQPCQAGSWVDRITLDCLRCVFVVALSAKSVNPQNVEPTIIDGFSFSQEE
jgi:hypothetical protein